VNPRAKGRALAAWALMGVFAVPGCRDAGPSLAERAAAARAAEAAADAKARDETKARLENERLAGLWRYQQATVGGGAQVTAAIVAAAGVDADGTGERPVQLVFRDHETWGKSGYLVLQAGDFACRPRCVVHVTVDDRAPERMAAWRPNTDEAIAVFINDTATLWRLTAAASRISIAFPVAAGGTRTASFEVAALDETKMPGW
jgi:hypothetical protein